VQPIAAKALRLATGAIVANVIGGAVCGFYGWMFAVSDRLSEPVMRIVFGTVYPNLLLVPFVMGLCAAYFWRPLALRTWHYLVGSLVTLLLLLAAAYAVVREGVVCLAIVSPILLAGSIAGALVGRVWFKPRPAQLQLAILPLLLLAVLAEGKIANVRRSVVTDSVVIAAPPSEVWKHVVAFPRITDEPDYWLNKIGLPSAAETTCEGEFVGAKRACIFSNGLVFKEVVAEIERERLLTFDIVEQPNDPELLGHVTLHRGQFQLQPNADGTTTLIGHSWYTLHVRPLWYFDLWTRDITREVHSRVMRHIKALSENAG
jgi:uncharacterized protein YndB with AHSA1/START domain